MKPERERTGGGFSMVELLVVIAILTIFVAYILSMWDGPYA